MKLNYQQVAAHLASGLLPVYLVSGDEPLLVDETLDSIRLAAREQGFDERESHLAERGFDWQALRAGMQNLSLFSSRRLFQVRLPTGKPGETGARFIAELTGDPPPETILVVVTPGLDSRTAKSKWVQALAKAGAWVQLRAPDRAGLPGWIAARLRQAGVSCDADSLELLASRVEGNLLAAKQEIDTLALVAGPGEISAETVRSVVGDGARFDVFQLTDAALAGDPRRAVRILQSLEREGVAAPLVLWSLNREIGVLTDVVFRVSAGLRLGQAMAEAGVWRSRQGLIGQAAGLHDCGSAAALVSRAWAAERICKGARRGRPWGALMELTLALAGSPEAAAETV